MAVSRLRWTAQGALAPGALLVPVMLIAGIPRVFTSAGVRPTTVAVTSGTVDTLFWPNTGSLTETLPDATTFDPIEDLLDPNETWEIYETTSLLEGSVDVETLTFSVLDTGGRGTALLSNREGRVSQELASDLDASATTVSLGSAVGMPLSGIAAINRETITYTGVSGSDLTGVTRGRYGSASRIHTAPSAHPPLVTAGGARHWQGRLATFWVATLSADGTTLTDPTLMYIGTVDKGVQLRRDLTRWSVTLQHVTKALTRKIEPRPVSLYGWSHYTHEQHGHPLQLFDALAGNLSLRWDPSDANDAAGWHPDATEFARAADAKARAGTSGVVSVQLAADGRLTVTVTGSDLSPTTTALFACWDASNRWLFHVTDGGNSPSSWASTARAPEACFSLAGWVKVPRSEDFGGIPTTFTFTATLGDLEGEASLALVCDTDTQTDVVCSIVERDATLQRIRLVAAGYPTDITVGGVPHFPLLCTKRTPARLGFVARGDTPVVALKAAAKAIDALTGQDLFESVIDWSDLNRAFLSSPSGSLPQSRVYRFHGEEDTFLDVLRRELQLRGMVMVMRNGRISGIRLQNFADAEATVAAIVENENLLDGGREITPEVIDNDEPLATRMKFGLPGDTSVEIEDSTYAGEFGSGETLECDALLSLGTSLRDVVSSTATLYDVAQQVLGALAEPNRTVRIPLPPTQMALQPGQLVAFTHSRIPTWEGTRGFDAAVCQVRDVRRVLLGGALRCTVGLRVQSGRYEGYSPEALVAAGGLGAASTTVTVDTLSGWGPTCFASEVDAFGADSNSAVDGFEVGDVVVLSQIGTRTPIADEQRTITAVDPIANTLTLSAFPGATMAATAAVQYGVIVRFAPYDQCTARQQSLFAWVADQTTQTLDGTDAPKRWAP